MNNETDYSSADFRLFVARVIYGWIFLVIAILLIGKNLPYQLPLDKGAWLMPSWVRPAISIAASTAILAAFFVPTRIWSAITTLLMIGFSFTYQHVAGNHFNSFGWWALLIPFILPPYTFYHRLRFNRWIIALFGVVHWLTTGLSVPAIPLYTLYFLPFLPYTRLFSAFNRQFEPR